MPALDLLLQAEEEYPFVQCADRSCSTLLPRGEATTLPSCGPCLFDSSSSSTWLIAKKICGAANVALGQQLREVVCGDCCVSFAAAAAAAAERMDRTRQDTRAVTAEEQRVS
jgi:hypothetical protein